MKWRNKGHEFDLLGGYFQNIDEIYIWGAGNNGKDIAKGGCGQKVGL